MGVIIDTIDYVTRIGNNATCAADPGCAALLAKIDDEVTNLGVCGLQLKHSSGHTNVSLE